MSEPRTIDIREALHGLPPPAPPQSGWPRLAVTLARQRRHRQRRWLLPAALAASLVLLLARPTGEPTLAPAPPLANAPSHADDARLAALQAESARLDALLAAAPSSVDAVETAALRMQIADRVAWIDALLASAPEPAARLALWGERVLLLRQLDRLASRESWLLAAATHPSATPMVSL
jgi:hypothetical protein